MRVRVAVLFSRQIIINFIRCALSRGGACARIFSRTTCSLSLVFKFSRIAAASTRVKRSDFYCISQLGTAAGNCAQRNILFYNVFTVSLTPLFYLIFALTLSLPLSFSSLSLYLSHSHSHTHTLSVVRLSHVSTLLYSFYDTFRNAFISRIDK